MSTLTEEYASYLEKKYLSAHEIYPQKFLLKGRWELLTKLDDYHKAYLREAYDDDVDDMFEDDLYMDLEFNWRLNKLNEAQELEHMHDGIYAIEHRQHKLFAGSEYS
ncbi:MAG TPA: hypothetical protein VEA37_12700 [Flavobacterium sp.]|nr:hypothetical protein [Flavobacterium sp.]